MDGEIELYIQVSIEKTDDGHRQAKLVRLPGQPEGNYKPECVIFRAWYPAQSQNPSAAAPIRSQTAFTPPLPDAEDDPAAPIKSAHLATVWLYWPPDLPGEKTRQRVYHHLNRTIRNYLRVDEYARIGIPAWHKSTGFYFVLAGSC
jgi:hypothetical protein